MEAYLPRCLDSILAQTYTNLEIVLVNDGSTDDSGKICNQYAKKDDRIRVIHKNNEGIASARNRLIQEARGTLFMFVDSDDYISQSAAASMLARMQKDESDLVFGKYISFHDDGTRDDTYCKWMKNAVLSKKEAFHRLENKETFWFGTWGKLYKAELFADIVFPPLICGEDTWVFPLILEQCDKVSILNQDVYYYYQRQDSIVHSHSERKKKDDLEATLHMTACLWENGYEKGAQRWYQLAVHRGYHLKNKIEARRLFKRYLNTESQRKLMWPQDVKTKVKGLVLKWKDRSGCSME
jgi:glycosyltransferase involved in cell wall biosynthesis